MKIRSILIAIVAVVTLSSCQGPLGLSIDPVIIGGQLCGGGAYYRPQYQRRCYQQRPYYRQPDYGCRHYYRPRCY